MIRITIVFVIFLILGSSCDNACNDPGTIDLLKISESGLSQEYVGLQISPYQRKDGLTMFSFPSGEEFLFNNKRNKIESRIYKGKESKTLTDNYDSLERYMIAKIDKLKELNLSAFVSDSSKNLIYTRFYDSTFNELLESNPKYRDIQYDSNLDRQYRYVLLHVFGSEEENNKTINKFKELYSIRKIKDDWYYYRSQFYSNSCSE